MTAQLQTSQRSDKRSRRAPSGLLLLRAAEHKLREGNVRDALKVFRTIVRRYPPSLERLAASLYLRSVSSAVRPARR
jgi:hypothetical protein